MAIDSYIPYGRQDITQDDVDAVVEVLRSDFLTQGPCVERFEEAVASYCGVAHSISCNSATSALHLACLALGLGPGDWLWTSPITFVASANCALYCGAQVDFVDIDPLSFNMCTDALEAKLIEAKGQNRLPKVLVPVHLCGQSCDMEVIRKLSETYNFKIIEDASHAVGGRYQKSSIGSCKYSDITVFSFHPVKIITTGEGGMALTNSEELADNMSLLRSHGITREQNKMVSESDGAWYYQQIALGFNYRMTDIQAALGLNQLKKLDDYVSHRQLIAERYNKKFCDFPLEIPVIEKNCFSAFHLYSIQLRDANIRRRIFDNLRSHGIGVNVHYIPVYRQPYYQNIGFEISDFPNAETFYSRAISLPMYPTMTECQQDKVIQTLHTALQL
jgi:UDP-4-amino-4,6-dideoxy-N-acetyl-beta-L-altrosamine transaminase